MSSEIFEAVKNPDLSDLHRIIQTDIAAVNARNPKGLPPLYTAALYRNKPAIDLLLDAGAELDIFACCYLDRPQECQQLLNATPELVHAATPDGQTPLHYAAKKGSPKVARILIDAGADVDVQVGRHGTPLLQAAHGGPWKPKADQEVITLLIAAGAHVDLHTAAGIGRADLLETQLDEHPEDIDSHDPSGYTPLYHAAHNDHPDCVKVLIDRSADVNQACADGQTALSSAALHLLSQQCDPEICRMLIAAGAPYDIHTAAALGDAEQISKLLQQDTSLANLELDGFRPADYAVHCGQLQSLKVLLEGGADPRAEDDTGQSLLSKSEHLPALHSLLSQYMP